jgi:hypothetical protein
MKFQRTFGHRYVCALENGRKGPVTPSTKKKDVSRVAYQNSSDFFSSKGKVNA